ncbi:MAG: glycosyl hydrolase, partial [Bacteroidales bacterium]
PGIDVLSCFPALTPIHSPKLASGAAELTGATRVMCEPCPVADRIKLGGQETPADHVRGFLNIQLLGGVTDFNNYLQLSNSDQEEKNEFNRYVARIAMLLRGGHTKAEIAVVYPIETMWTKWIPKPVSVAGWDSVSGGNPDAVMVEQSFRNVSRFLYNHRWEYAYIDSKAIIDAEVKDGKLVHGLLQWKVIILPAVNTLPAEAWRKLALFAEAGGIVISLNAMPENSESHFPDETVLKIGKEIFNRYDKSVILKDWSPTELNRLLTKFLVKDFRLGDEQVPVRYCHRMIDGRDCFFLINDSDKEVKTSLQFDENRRFTEWDPASGKTRSVKGVIELELPAFHGKVYR